VDSGVKSFSIEPVKDAEGSGLFNIRVRMEGGAANVILVSNGDPVKRVVSGHVFEDAKWLFEDIVAGGEVNITEETIRSTKLRWLRSKVRLLLDKDSQGLSLDDVCRVFKEEAFVFPIMTA
jgi:hypothetical protein